MTAPVITNEHGQLPNPATARWLNAHLFTHADTVTELIAHRLPELLAAIDPAPEVWFVRYRSPTEPDHLRIRLRTRDPGHYHACLTALGHWADRLRHDRLASRLTLTTYLPEVGRYGTGPALHAAENVFVADTAVVAAQFRHVSPSTVDPVVLAAVNMIALACGLLGSHDRVLEWLRTRRVTASSPLHQGFARTVADFTADLNRLPGWAHVADAWHERDAALAHYREHLSSLQADAVLESLMHMHHNRAQGIDRERESSCRRLARAAALTWHARHHQAVRP
ncbi:thiopeptide-type bacteriocin biosynthesis protein [Amycolatopsis acidicola]|uniref:thiopeptide-type bacteriocin biosynthesis protein n=1 Tax=Amycolatopsis acidicola TaxID=2596893 RepID=UPI001FB5BF55|nr:thiopeptide-type bacteriocin biosynthesis protein [Amycolatopsis acidicola]